MYDKRPSRFGSGRACPRQGAAARAKQQQNQLAVDAAVAAASTMVVGVGSLLLRRRRGRRPAASVTSTVMTCLLLLLPPLLLLAPALASRDLSTRAPLKERILRSSAIAAANSAGAGIELPERINPSPGTDRCTTMIVGPKVGMYVCAYTLAVVNKGSGRETAIGTQGLSTSIYQSTTRPGLGGRLHHDDAHSGLCRV